MIVIAASRLVGCLLLMSREFVPQCLQHTCGIMPNLINGKLADNYYFSSSILTEHPYFRPCARLRYDNSKFIARNDKAIRILLLLEAITFLTERN